MTKPYYLISLEAENFKRLKAVRLELNGASVTIGGPNEAGKSSTLDAVEALLGGKKAMPQEPIREGEESARIVGRVGDLVITRTFEKGDAGKVETKLVVSSPEGAKYSSPQAMLDKLFGELSFDPLAFTRMEKKARRDMLAGLVGVDFSLLDRKRQTLFDERTTVNRDVKRLEAQLAGMPHHKDAPAQVVSISEISESIKAAQDKQAEADAARRASDEAERAVKEAAARADALEAQEAALLQETQAEDARHLAAIDAENARHRAAIDAIEERNRARREALAKAMEAMPDLRATANDLANKYGAAVEAVPDTAPLYKELEEAEGTNRKVRENAEHKALAVELAQETAKAESLTEQIAAIDKQKVETLASTEFPVEGLSFSDDGVLYNGLPFEQASQARKLRISCAIGVARNPGLRTLLIREGAFLDDEALRSIAEFARENAIQLLIERVGKGAEVGIVIEDGEVAEVRQAAE